MSSLRYDEALHLDLQRIVTHLVAHEAEDIEARIGEIFEALGLLARHPLIGRPAGPTQRELVIGRGSHGYVARYRFDALDDAVIVLALRSQREAGFEDV